MKLEEKISKHLNIPYVYLENEKKFLCQNGVLFSLEEYQKGIDLKAECEKRELSGNLFDYEHAKRTGKLLKLQKVLPEKKETVKEQAEESSPVSYTTWAIIASLSITAVISAYISTLHTATYLYDYVDTASAWLMSASVTSYNATAFEVAVLFKSRERYGLTFIFISLWTIVTLFSMATTVSVFYDRFNFTETQIQEENKQGDVAVASLEILKKQEKDLREAIEFKKQDIEYRQKREYATTAVRTELNNLQTQLQNNLYAQQKVLQETPQATQKHIQRKESLFAFLGRLLHIEGGVMEFIMSTLSAVFVNIVCPFSLVAVGELNKQKTLDNIK